MLCTHKYTCALVGEHNLDVGTASPVKVRLRRSPCPPSHRPATVNQRERRLLGPFLKGYLFVLSKQMRDPLASKLRAKVHGVSWARTYIYCIYVYVLPSMLPLCKERCEWRGGRREIRAEGTRNTERDQTKSEEEEEEKDRESKRMRESEGGTDKRKRVRNGRENTRPCT